jgi:hypothetical protein
MNKRLVIEKIMAKLAEDLEVLYNAARASHAEATHESSKAENKYDTRGLEAGYLAQGQMKHAGEIEQTMAEFQKMSPVRFAPETPIGISALIEVKDKDVSNYYFIGPRGGGVVIEHQGKEIIVLTPQAPLGEILIGKKMGQRFKFKQGPFSVDYHIHQVW